MFRRRAVALSSCGVNAVTGALRSESLASNKASSFRATCNTGFFHKRASLHREHRLLFSTESKPYFQSSVPVVIAIACGAGASAVFLSKWVWDNSVHAEGDQKGTDKKEEEGFFDQVYKKLTGSVSSAFNTGSDGLLLPDPDPPPYTKKYTIVVSDDALLSRSYNLKEGFATKKRPSVEYFLATLAAMDYEIVIFSLQGVQTYSQMIEKLDPNHHALHRLFLDSTGLSPSGKQIKDLTRLNRDLSKVLAIDIDEEGVIPAENLIVVPKYTGKEASDTTLLDMIPFFKLIAHSSGDTDVRKWMTLWKEKGPKHFREWLEEALKKANEQRRAPAEAAEDDPRMLSKRRQRF